MVFLVTDPANTRSGNPALVPFNTSVLLPGTTADPDVLQTLAALGYQEVRWQVEGPDWEPGTDGIEMAARMVRGAIDHGDGTVILGHPWTDACLAGLPGLIEGLRLADADLVRVDDLDTLPGAP